MTTEQCQALAKQAANIRSPVVLYLVSNGSPKAGGWLRVEECPRPWAGLDLAPLLTTNDTTLLVGLKNTGKSTLCEYILNRTLQDAVQSKKDVCVLDLDVGRNRTYPGCISLTIVQGRAVLREISIWVGEYTVLNNTETYLRAVRHLYELYRREHFGSGLVINTMGYLTGLGELLIYEIFHIVKPHRVILMEGPEASTGSQQPDSEGVAQHAYLSRIRREI